MSEKKFPLGFWNYQSVKKYGPKEVERWARCGMSVVMSPTFNYETDKVEEMIAFLDECQKYGLKMIITIHGLSYNDVDLDAPDDYRKKFVRARDDFARHPATFGFEIGDEPWGNRMMECCAVAYDIQREEAPWLQPFINFYPYWDELLGECYGNRSFEEWIDAHAERTNNTLYCYDHYGQMVTGRKDGIGGYYENLLKYSLAAQRNNADFWVTNLSAGHFRYRAPTENDFRWQLNTSAACGARGVLWFLFYGWMPCNNYHGYPIDPWGNETESYTWLTRVQRYFNDMYGELLMNLKFKKAYQYVETFGGYEDFSVCTHPLIKTVTTDYGQPGIISFFEDDKGREYTCIVNNSQTETDHFVVHLDKKTKSIIRTALNNKRNTDFRKFHHDADFSERDDELCVGFWLNPGQMEIFRFDENETGLY